MSYRIGELAEKVGMTIHGLRFYEKEGLIKPERQGNNRVYSEEDYLWIKFLLHMKATGMSLHDMKRYTDLRKSANPPLEELMAILTTHRQSVLEQIALYQANLEVIENKIKVYQEQIDENKGKDLFDSFKEDFQGAD
ncbi:MerR family transcriptional regulator [Fundicoccus culcitae]|uniref:MerR family transcriptional regulator n=1 Tax=Fundicoccus culcitae TaxID=2969821 RepID=A0ABY5P880_9LACT|nr:MerR family transcriptional regulator [Fundicoccus culcitae]UUX34941.1 MerR family transcriptional regulator [Fundicoccus culcitae]